VPWVLCTRRSHEVSMHKGQVSLPGGVRDRQDADVFATALRETEEEIGLARKEVRILGRFDDYTTHHGYHVAVCVGSASWRERYRYNPREIAAVFYAPLEFFFWEKNCRTDRYNFNGQDIPVIHYYYEGYHIWGLTARFLNDFAVLAAPFCR
jgi:8-oxo-dGTP pyrophosphatase MutT (NUDIX family)